MNRTEANRQIKKHKHKTRRAEGSIQYCTFRISRLKKQVQDLENELQESKDKILQEETYVEKLEKQLTHESNCKRKVTSLLKKYPQLDLTDESDDEYGGTYLWLYCELFNENNYQDDPYDDEHYMDDWKECLERCNTYIKLIEETREVA